MQIPYRDLKAGTCFITGDGKFLQVIADVQEMNDYLIQDGYSPHWEDKYLLACEPEHFNRFIELSMRDKYFKSFDRSVFTKDIFYDEIVEFYLSNKELKHTLRRD